MNASWTRALVESLQRAPLLVGDLPEARQFDRTFLSQADGKINLNARQKLGHLYESALEQLLRQSLDVDVLASSLQIIDASGRTRGEMDYVLWGQAESLLIHLELAVKFYLAYPSAAGWRFPGPDPKDDWYAKLRRMRTHQLRLSETVLARRVLQDRYGAEVGSVRQLIYGRLFLPFDREDCPMPNWLAPNAMQGRWLYLHQLNEALPSLREVKLLPKALWPVELTAELRDGLPKISEEELKQQAEKRCVMFVMPDSFEPLFLVPDRWPDSEL